MSFLNPLLLFGLPLVLLPIVIHLINRRRHRTIPWGAMMFLLDAKRLQRSMQKLRYWLIMAMRMLAIAGLVFAASRPLSSGWLGVAIGSKADTIILLLDRSPSMGQQDPVTRISKRETGLRQLADLLEKTGEGKRIVLLENTRLRAEEIQASQLLQLPEVSPTDTLADIPRMLQAALDYLVANEIGQADIWVVSDLRVGDWRNEDGRWAALRDGFANLDGVRLNLLTYSAVSDDNFSVSVDNVRKRQVGDADELVLDVAVRRSGEDQATRTVPVEFTVNGARSVMEVEIVKNEFVLQGHVIPLDSTVETGWGRVDIPGDANPRDNVYYFVFADESPRHVAIVSDDEDTSRPLRIAGQSSPDPAIPYTAEVLPTSRTGELDWEQTTCLIWHAPLPKGTLADQVLAFLRKNKPVLFLPPHTPDPTNFVGMNWGQWIEARSEAPIGVAAWDSDSDLLVRTQSGNALPVGKQRTYRYCQLSGVGKPLARLSNGDALLVRAGDNMPAYFLTTTTNPNASSLARDGIVLYAMLHRAIELGAKQQGNARLLEAGSIDPEIAASWSVLSETTNGIATPDRVFIAACYSSGDQQIAINRPAAEDIAKTIDDVTLDRMLAGLDYQKIGDEPGAISPLASEVWRAFLVLMAMALIVEAVLCLV